MLALAALAEFEAAEPLDAPLDRVAADSARTFGLLDSARDRFAGRSLALDSALRAELAAAAAELADGSLRFLPWKRSDDSEENGTAAASAASRERSIG